MGGACRMYGSDGKCPRVLEKLKRDPYTEGRMIILK
jgi:hypothetical protein